MEEVRNRLPALFEQMQEDIRDKDWESIVESLNKVMWLSGQDSVRVMLGFIELADKAACEKLIHGDSFSIASFSATQNNVNATVFREISKVKRKNLVMAIHEQIPKLKFYQLSKMRLNSSINDPLELVQTLIEIYKTLQEWIQIACMHISYKFEKTHKKSTKTYLTETFYNEVVFVIHCRFKDYNEIKVLTSEFAPRVANKYGPSTVQKNLYFGELSEDGLREGFGRVSLPTGEKFEGFWKNDMYHGEGLYVWKKKEWFKGNFVSGQMHGIGKRKFNNGSVYVGDFLKGKMQGRGRITFENGDVYDGSFANDTMCGEGEYTWAKSGDRFRGIMKGDIRQSGVILLQNGDEYRV